MKVAALALALAASAALAAHAEAAACFTVAGEKASVHNIFKDGKPQVVELDMPSVSTMESRGSEARNMIFTKIKRDDRKNVTGFSAKIDGKDYEYPKDACPKK